MILLKGNCTPTFSPSLPPLLLFLQPSQFSPTKSFPLSYQGNQDTKITANSSYCFIWFKLYSGGEGPTAIGCIRACRPLGIGQCPPPHQCTRKREGSSISPSHYQSTTPLILILYIHLIISIELTSQSDFICILTSIFACPGIFTL